MTEDARTPAGPPVPAYITQLFDMYVRDGVPGVVFHSGRPAR